MKWQFLCFFLKNLLTLIIISDELEDVALQEELDDLSPLMTDNHTILEHKELYIDADDDIKYLEPSMSRCDFNERKNSLDSDISSTYDRRNSDDMSFLSSEPLPQPFVPLNDYMKTNIEYGSDKIDTTDANIDDSPIEIPSDDLSEKIVEQVEFYFSNENILKDAFLLKHVRRNKEGFVSLKLVSSFKRVRQLTKDWRVVGYAIKVKSNRIQLNDVETKIRRLEPLPVYDETMPSRTVVATDLPYSKITIENVSDLFSKCGEIALVRILRPGGAIPADVRQFMNKYPELQQKECALIEFIESHCARIAQNMNDVNVYEMVASKKKTGRKATVTKIVENYKFTENDVERSRGGDYKFRIKRDSPGFYIKPDTHMCSPRKISFNNENFEHFHRRNSNCSATSSDISRKYSSCSEGYSSCSEMSRRPSASDMSSRRTSNCSDIMSRRSSCSDYCYCSRRLSQCSDIYRRMSQCSEHNRKFSVGPSNNLERRISNASESSRHPDMNYFERKTSAGSIGYEPQRKFSANFEMMRKLSNENQFCSRKLSNDSGYDRKISIDSGYDRKLSSGSDISNTMRVRTGIALHSTNQETLVRTPIGPDGSKGFASRTRKIGQAVPPL